MDNENGREVSLGSVIVELMTNVVVAFIITAVAGLLYLAVKTWVFPELPAWAVWLSAVYIARGRDGV